MSSLYEIRFEKSAIKFLQKQDKPTRERVMKIIQKLPDGTDIKKLQGYENLYHNGVFNKTQEIGRKENNPLPSKKDNWIIRKYNGYEI